MPAKLYELIAVQSDQDSKEKQILAETAKVLVNNRDLFWGSVKRTTAFDQSKSQALDGEEVKERTTTVEERIRYTFKAITATLDRTATIDRTNCVAKADLIIRGKLIASDVPAVTLLAIEREGKRWLDMLQHMPTLQAGIAWEPADGQGPHVFVTKHPVVKKKTEKIMTAVELSPATKEHKAQVKEVTNDVPVADIIETTYSGMVTSQRKADILERVNELIVAAKEARTRANDVVVIDLKIGKAIESFLLD